MVLSFRYTAEGYFPNDFPFDEEYKAFGSYELKNPKSVNIVFIKNDDGTFQIVHQNSDYPKNAVVYEKGDYIGYTMTDFTYPSGKGDLSSNAGETI
jgi:hypothetical protein